MMDLREWRESKEWSRSKLASMLNKRLKGREHPISGSHIQAWENGTMPGADIGEAIRKLSRGSVVWEPNAC